MANVQYIAFFQSLFPVFCSRTGFLPSPPLGLKKNRNTVCGMTSIIMSVSDLSLESHCLCSFGYYCFHCDCFCTDSFH